MAATGCLEREAQGHSPEERTPAKRMEAMVDAVMNPNAHRPRSPSSCGRLGLTALAFMWQASQSALLSKIIGSGMSCILVKVAGIGLDERDLGRTLNTLEPKLRRLNAAYGLHICGEGGEYETVTLDSPLFHERISLCVMRCGGASMRGGFGFADADLDLFLL